MDEEAYLRKFANVILKGINSRNPRKNVSKEEQIYGIWAENSEDPKTTKSQRFTKGSKTPQISISEDHFGSWEKHTTGFGSKMLEKMGYAQGQGLGKRGSGIIEPIQAVPRQGRATLGAYGSDNNSVYQNSLPTVIEQKPEIIKDLKTHSWKKINRSRPNYIIKTFEQLLLEAQKATFIDDSVKVVDMTGSETKVTYGYETIQPKFNEEVVVKPKNFDLPELYHNIDILVKTSEKTLKSFIKNVAIKKDVLNTFNSEKASLINSINILKAELDEILRIWVIVDELKTITAHPTTPLTCAKYFISFFENFNDLKFNDLNLEGLIGSTFYPLLFSVLKTWDLFNEPEYLIPIFSEWKNAVNEYFRKDGDLYNSDYSDEVYDKTYSDLWLPRLYESLQKWDLSEYSPVIHFLNIWKPLLNDSIWLLTKTTLLNCLIIHIDKCKASDVENMLWTQSYRDILDKDLDSVHKIILRKFMQWFENWEPSDPSPIAILTPWAKILTKDQMQGFLARSIRPKLIDCLQTKLIINPRNQILDPLMWILRWKNIMDTQSMAFVLSRGFSLKWLNVIHRWLSQTPNYEDVKKWYTGWKSLFIDYIDHPSIQFIFTQALEMIDFSMKGLPIPTPKEYTPPVVNNPPAVGPTRISLTFKEIIEKEATINGIIFTPTVKKRPDGKTIYHFGGNNIYIDRDVIFIEKSPNQPWVPISINNLISASSKM